MVKIQLTTPNAYDHVEQGHSLFACRMQNGTTIWKRTWQRFLTKQNLTILSSNFIPWYLPQGVESVSLYTDCINMVRKDFIHNCNYTNFPQLCG